jgi:ribonuclease HII
MPPVLSGRHRPRSVAAEHFGECGGVCPVAVVIGIDEAGYGPLLGPLVSTAVAFKVPAEQVDASLWTLLRKSVARRLRARDARLLITDSKKAYSQATGIRRLETAALSVLHAAGRSPSTLLGLLRILSPQLPNQLDEYPWYRDFDLELPVDCQADSLKIHANALARDLADAGIAFRGVWCEILLEGHFNRLVAGTRNKSVVLSDLAMRLIQRADESLREPNLTICIDKQGGRDAYGHTLMRSFESAHLHIIEEGPHCSRYELRGQPAVWTVSFMEKGEDHHLPVALASMFSKYLRELFMKGFNRFWQARLPDLVPTAGYYQDGQRFLQDIEAEVRRLEVPREHLVRSR